MDGNSHQRSARQVLRKCPVCARNFSKTEHLERHIRSHTKEKPYRCHQCGRRYGRNDSLLRHVKDQHKHSEIDAEPSTLPSVHVPTVDQAVISPILGGSQVETSGQVTQSAINLAGGIADLSGDARFAPLHSLENDWNVGDVLPEAHWSSTGHENLDEVFSIDPNTTPGFENWLTHGILDNFVRTWPFVIEDSDLSYTTNEVASDVSKQLPDLQQSWYTNLDGDEPAISARTTPPPSQGQEVDDNYRQSLHRRLQIRVSDQKLPSTDYLNLCVKAYFKRFHPIFPVIHAATFRPSHSNAVLLLSICSIGSLLTGHPNAVQRGTQLFERLNKAIIHNWEMLMRRGADDNFAMIQAALIGQTFGLLSGLPKHLVLVDTFHGTIIAWARRFGVFQVTHQPIEHTDLSGRWHEWVSVEEKIRVALAVRIHEAEIASMLHHENLLPFASKKALFAQSDASFFAPNAQEWQNIQIEEARKLPKVPIQPLSSGNTTLDTLHQRLLSISAACNFSIYSSLEDVLSAIIEARSQQPLTENFVQKAHQSLLAFYQQYCNSDSSSDANTFISKVQQMKTGIKILWHSLHISLNADLELLEKCIGRDGPELSPSDVMTVRSWANSDLARRSVAHAVMIKRDLERFSLTAEPAIHVPRALFSGAICIFCFLSYRDDMSMRQGEFPEFQLLNVDVVTVLREVSCRKQGGNINTSPLCGFIDLLQRIGHWGIARKFASILSVLINNELT